MTDTELVGVQKTLSPVLRAKALDNLLPDPILGDEYAEQAMRRLDPDHDKRRFGTSQMSLAAVVRPKAHDDWAKAPANMRRMYRLMNLLPGMKPSTRIVRVPVLTRLRD